jgi:hypothetical protein
MTSEGGETEMKKARKVFPALLIPALFLFMGITFGQAQQEQTPPLRRPAKAQRIRTQKKAAPGEDMGFGKTESLSGTLSMVDSASKLVVVVTPTGVPFDFQVTAKTRIEVAGKAGTLADLEGQTNKDVLVDFTPQRTGNVARSIKVAGS